MSPVWTSVMFTTLFSFRYLRLMVGIASNILYRPYRPASDPSFVTRDVTAIVATTFRHPSELVRCLRSIAACAPSEVFVVAGNSRVQDIQRICAAILPDTIDVLGVERLNKRHQLVRALRLVKTDIVVFADDNVIWPEAYLEHLLAVFEDPKVGAGGTRQRVRRAPKPNIWNFLAISYLERRVFNNITTQAIDGSISTLSGRTAAYRTEILKNERFFQYLLGDSWRGRKLNSDDDKCLTRFVYSNGWKIALQKSVVIETSMEDGWTYIEQCTRWARSHWRGNFVVMTNERYWYSLRYFWGFYAIYLSQFQTPSVVYDGLQLFFLKRSLVGNQYGELIQLGFVCWIILTKLVKLVPHFIAHPADLRFVPLSLLFSYLHGFINIYALLTLHVTHWGSQQLEDLDGSKTSCDMDHRHRAELETSFDR